MPKKSLFLILFITLQAAFLLICCTARDTTKIPIVYSPHYDIKIFGIQRLHPFDSEKYSKVMLYLTKELHLNQNQFYAPEPVTEEILLQVHTVRYLQSLRKSKVICEIAETKPLSFIPAAILDRKILLPMRYAAGGTILGTNLAIKHRWAINLSGGYHHAKADEGSGFCFYADINLAVQNLHHIDSTMKIMIIDLDAHQGNGYASIIKDDPRVIIFDMFTYENYPADQKLYKYMDYKIPLNLNLGDEKYLKILKSFLTKALKKTPPDFIIYNAGTDILAGDKLGKLKVSEKGIIERDAYVFKQALDNEIPVLMLLSGGYTKESAEVIGKSIQHLYLEVIGEKESGN